jgi:hypothetical protein
MAKHHKPLPPVNPTGPVAPGSTLHRLLELAAEQVAAELAAGSTAETKSRGRLGARAAGGKPPLPRQKSKSIMSRPQD